MGGEEGRSVAWGPTIKLAVGRSLASGLIIGIFILFNGGPAGPSLGAKLQMIVTMPVSLLIGAPAMYYLLLGMRAVLTPLAGDIVGLACNFMMMILSVMVAIGDPIIYLINRSAPHIFEVDDDFKLFNFKIWMIVLDTAEGRRQRAEAREAERVAQTREAARATTDQPEATAPGGGSSLFNRDGPAAALGPSPSPSASPSALAAQARSDEAAVSAAADTGLVLGSGPLWIVIGAGLLLVLLGGRMIVQAITKPKPGEAAVTQFATRMVRVRDAPTGQGSKVVATLQRGDMVTGVWTTAADGQTRWLRARLRSGAQGFVWEHNLDGQPRPAIARMINAELKVIASTQAYASPSANSATVGAFEPGDRVTAVGDIGSGWDEVMLKQGGVGYMPAAAAGS